MYQNLPDNLWKEGLREIVTCPITNTVMRDPVLTVDGHSYERSAVENWLQNPDLVNTFPLPGTQSILEDTTLFQNIALKQLIEAEQSSGRLPVPPPPPPAVEQVVRERESMDTSLPSSALPLTDRDRRRFNYLMSHVDA